MSAVLCKSRRPGLAAVLGLALALVCAPLAAQQRVGTTLFARGAATASQAGKVRLMGNGTAVYERDVLTTGSRSFAIVKFEDGTRMTLRPNTVFRVDELKQDSGSESFLARLFKGGLRAVTGLVSKRNPDGFKLNTPVATIGIRGTDFSARLCGEDCVREAEKAGPGGAKGPAVRVVARAAFVKGSLEAQDAAGERRRVVTGGALYPRDTLETGPGSFAVVAFTDQTRVTLKSNSRFVIERHDYDRAKPAEGSSLLRLLRGGLRMVSGLIGRANPNRVKIATPVATIGIRGTAFDLVCQGECAGAEQSGAAASPATRALARLLGVLVPEARAQAGLNGMFVVTRVGTVVAELPGGNVINVPQGATAFFGGPAAPPRFDIPLPAAVLRNLGPVPESVPVDPGAFQEQAAKVEPGQLWAAVNDEGHMTVTQDGTSIDLGKGEAAVAGGTGATRSAGGTPQFIVQDPYNIKPPDVDAEGGLPPSKIRDPESSLSCEM